MEVEIGIEAFGIIAWIARSPRETLRLMIIMILLLYLQRQMYSLFPFASCVCRSSSLYSADDGWSVKEWPNLMMMTYSSQRLPSLTRYRHAVSFQSDLIWTLQAMLLLLKETLPSSYPRRTLGIFSSFTEAIIIWWCDTHAWLESVLSLMVVRFSKVLCSLSLEFFPWNG